MDAGVGVKAYAVIEQGKIGQILSARPTDRRQLIEEAAGVTKYKSRRRAAELKLEAAQQNLTRVDDIVFEVEKQRGTLKRQAAKARRYKRLREELRRWEKVQFAAALSRARPGHRGGADRARGRARARDRGRRPAGRARDRRSSALRLELTEADGQATAAREAAHASEMEIGRLQQQIAFDSQQIEQLTAAAADIETEVRALDARQEPARQELEARRDAAARAASERDQAAADARRPKRPRTPTPSARSRGSRRTSRRRAARSLPPSTRRPRCGTRWSMPLPRGRGMAEQIAALDAEDRDLGVEAERAAQRARGGRGALDRARAAMDGCASIARHGSRSSSARAADRDGRASELRTREHELAGAQRAAESLEELDAARAQYGDGARTILAESQRRSRAHGLGRRLPRSRPPLRARRRSVSWRSAAARRRARRTNRRPPACGWRASAMPAASDSWSPRTSVGALADSAIDVPAGPDAPRRCGARVCGPAATRFGRSLATPGSRRTSTSPGAAARVRPGRSLTLDGDVLRGPTSSRVACAPKQRASCDEARDQGAARACRRAARGSRSRREELARSTSLIVAAASRRRLVAG